MVYIKETYNNPEIVVTENGFADEPDELNDSGRISYIQVSTYDNGFQNVDLLSKMIKKNKFIRAIQWITLFLFVGDAVVSLRITLVREG